MNDSPTTDDTAPLGWAVTETIPYAGSAPAAATSPATAPSRAASPSPTPPSPASATAPAVNPPTWTGRKTAIAAALAIGISSLGAVGAAAALPAGAAQGETGGQLQRGGFAPGGQLPGGQAPTDPSASTT